MTFRMDIISVNARSTIDRIRRATIRQARAQAEIDHYGRIGDDSSRREAERSMQGIDRELGSIYGSISQLATSDHEDDRAISREIAEALPDLGLIRYAQYTNRIRALTGS